MGKRYYENKFKNIDIELEALGWIQLAYTGEVLGGT
jgi:hypothetical protein